MAISEEARMKMRMAKLGKSHGHKTSNGSRWTHSEETRKRMSLAHNPVSDINLYFRLRKGNIPWNKGKVGLQKCSEEQKRIKSQMYSGSRHPQYIHDRTKVKGRHTRVHDSCYKEWRRQVWLRDNFVCKIANPNCGGRIEAHHILTWRGYPELRYQVNNGITLCHFHHPRKREDEKKLSPYFQELVTQIEKPSSLG